MRESIRIQLEGGASQREVARTLGLSESTVSREARRLNFGGRRSRTRLDWEAIRAFYNDGHTLAECRTHFGFSNGAWDAAVTRGDIVPRRESSSQPSGTRVQVQALLADGKSGASIARELGLSAATISHHSRALGVAPREACARRYDWAAIQTYYDEGHSQRECQERFGFASKTWHDAVGRGAIVSRPAAAPIETYLTSGRRVSRTHLKSRLFAARLKRAVCERCGISRWRQAPLSLCLHHVNGDRDDNRLENLEVLCPNCHSQTPNFAGRNGRS
jgi:transposase